MRGLGGRRAGWLGGVLAACSLGEPAPTRAPPAAAPVVFAGDLSPTSASARVLLHHPDPWAGLRRTFGEDAVWVVNLEAAVGDPAACRRTDGLCRVLPPAAVEHLERGPFATLSRANNHALDTGTDPLPGRDAGRYPTTATTTTVSDPSGHAWAVVPLDLTTLDRPTLERAVRAVSRARAWTPRVVAFLHSAVELDPRPGFRQRTVAATLHAHGATLVVGSGSHVVQAATCGETSATWHGLGNLWMDQRPAETQRGLAVGCTSDGSTLTCIPRLVRHDAHHPPEPEGPPLEPCTLPLGPVDRSWQVHPRADRFVQVLPLPAAGPGTWVALWPQHSDFDHTTELRPYVFRLHTPSDGPPTVEDLWRGTTLSSPIAWMAPGPEGRLCVFHRTDSVFTDDPDTGGRRLQAWRWTGFGFEPDPAARCDLPTGP